MTSSFSRKIFEAANAYRGVMMQQGRVQVDDDWYGQAVGGARKPLVFTEKI